MDGDREERHFGGKNNLTECGEVTNNKECVENGK